MNVSPRLETIRKKVLKIGELAKTSIRVSMEALRNRDSGLCDEVKEIERETDFLNLELEDICLEVLSSEKLSEKPFRFVATSMNISSRFERIADLAVEISEYCMRGLPKPLPEPSLELPKMAQNVKDMIEINLEAIYNDRMVSIEKLRSKEGELKSLYQTIYGKFVSYTRQYPESFDDAMLLLRIALTLERAAEVACKIGNRIVYVMDGKRVWIE